MQTTFVFSFLFCVSLVDSTSLFATSPIKALDDIQKALMKVTALPHLSSSQQKSAKSVVDFVMHTVQEVENAPNMTKEVKAKKFKEAIGRLQGLEHKWVEAANNMTASERRIGELQAQLAEKRQELAKEEGMLKLAKLKKELAEKKLLLKKLVEKAHEHDHEATEEEEVKLPDSEVKQIDADANKVAKGNKKKASKFAEVLKMLHEHKHEIMEDLKKLEDAEQTSDAQIMTAIKDADAKKEIAVEKRQRILKRIKSKTDRMAKKAKAAKLAELADVTAAIKGIETGDVKVLQKALAKMMGEAQSPGESAKFIY